LLSTEGGSPVIYVESGVSSNACAALAKWASHSWRCKTNKSIVAVEVIENDLFASETLDERIEFAAWDLELSCELGFDGKPPKCDLIIRQ